MDNTEQEYTAIYLPPDVEMTDGELIQADDFLQKIMEATYGDRILRNEANKSVYVYIETAISCGHWAYLRNYLHHLRGILSESLSETEAISSSLLRLSQVIASYESIAEQMELLYFNLVQIDRELFANESVAAKITATADSLVEQNKEEIKEWINQMKEEYNYQLPDKQLELDLELT